MHSGLIPVVSDITLLLYFIALNRHCAGILWFSDILLLMKHCSRSHNEVQNISATTVEITAVHYCAAVLHAAFMGSLPALSEPLHSDTERVFMRSCDEWVVNWAISAEPTLFVIVKHLVVLWVFLKRLFLIISCKLLNFCTVNMNYAVFLFCSCSVIWE